MCLTVYKIQHRDHPRKQAVVHFNLAYVGLLPSLRYLENHAVLPEIADEHQENDEDYLPGTADDQQGKG